MRTLTLLATLLLLWPAVAWGQTVCNFNAAGASNWGPIGTATTDCGTESGINTFVAPEGEDVTATEDLTWTLDDTAFSCQDGASFTASAVDQDAAIRLTVFSGADDYPTSQTNVAVHFESGCAVDLRGGYAQWGDATPTLQASVSEDLHTVWTVDQWVACGDGANDAGDTIGGNMDCDNLDEEYQWCLTYTRARNNPEYDGAPAPSDNHLFAAMGDIPAVPNSWMVAFLSDSMEYPHVYPIVKIDKIPTTYVICVDTRQQYAAYGQASADRPLADRATILDEINNAAGVLAKKGDTCIESNGDLLATPPVGGYVGSCVRLCDTSVITPPAENCDPYIYKIAKTLDDEHCDGSESVGHTAIHLSDLTPLRRDYDTDAPFTISVICAEAGDQFAILAPISIVNADTSYADNEAKIIIESTDVTMQGVVINGSGLVHFDMASLNPESDMVHVIDGGPVQFENMSRVDLSCWTKVGGDVAGGNAGFEFINISDRTTVEDTKVRYSGDWAFMTSGDAMGPATFERTACEMIGHATATNEGCIFNDTDWESVRMQHVGCFDCMGGSDGITAHAFASATSPMIANGVVAYGTTKGGISAHGDGAAVELMNVLSRGNVSNRTSLPFLPPVVRHLDLDDLTAVDATVPVMPSVASAAITLTDFVISNVTTGNDEVVTINEDSNPISVISNGVIWNAVTTSTSNDVLLVYMDSVAATQSTVEYVTIGWDRGHAATDWDRAISVANDDGTETGFNFGSILVTEHNGSDNAEDYIGIGLDPQILDKVTNRTGGNYCVHAGSVASGGAGSYTPVTSIASFTANIAEPRLGRAPQFSDVGRGSYDVVHGSLLGDWGCGAKRGSAAPGVIPNGNCWLYEQIGAKCPRRSLIRRPDGAF